MLYVSELIKQIHSPTRVRVYVKTIRTSFYIDHIINIISLLILIIYIIFVAL